MIAFISKEEIEEFISEAEKICKDAKDIAYFALALKLKCPIWSNDKKLRELNKIRVYSTEELVKIFAV